jgi:DNA-binding response OmpR family regulator
MQLFITRNYFFKISDNELTLYKEQIMDRNYLLIIDPEPLDPDIKTYFSQFSITIVHETNALLIPTYPNLPYALLIDYSVLKDNPELIKQFYTKYSVPLLITSEYRNEDFCITMLESGADDFLIKPLFPRELHARINAISRRVLRAPTKLELERDVLIFSHWKVYPSSRQIFDINNTELILSVGEYELLLIFIQNPHKILHREYLCQVTKNNPLKSQDRRIDIQISRLRQKIEHDARKPALIKTIRNSGYMFTTSVTMMVEKETL